MVASAEGSAGLGWAERAGTLGGAVPVRGDVTGRHGDGCLYCSRWMFEILSPVSIAKIARYLERLLTVRIAGGGFSS
jgi:hypothetical protein